MTPVNPVTTLLLTAMAALFARAFIRTICNPHVPEEDKQIFVSSCAAVAVLLAFRWADQITWWAAL